MISIEFPVSFGLVWVNAIAGGLAAALLFFGANGFYHLYKTNEETKYLGMRDVEENGLYYASKQFLIVMSISTSILAIALALISYGTRGYDYPIEEELGVNIIQLSEPPYRFCLPGSLEGKSLVEYTTNENKEENLGMLSWEYVQGGKCKMNLTPINNT